jgi:beta-glucosidase
MPRDALRVTRDRDIELKVLPENFKFGVATSAFQIEGGMNGPGEPANNWLFWERSGLVEPSGAAVNFWDRYEEHLDRAAAMGCEIFRVGIEWARVEPEHGEIDTAALDRYRAILDACIERGMEPMVTLHHFTHPSWLGDDFWLSSESPALFSSWVRLALEHLAEGCTKWITLNELNILGFASYLIGIYPPGRKLAMSDFHLATAHLLAAHVKAYEAIHEKIPGAKVSTNNSSTSIYEHDRLFIDLLFARSSGVAREDLGKWLTERRIDWYLALDPPSGVERVLRRATSASAPIARVELSLGSFSFGLGPRDEGALASAIEALYASPHELALDAVAIDYYDPVASNHLRLPGHATAGGRSMEPGREIWDEIVNPAGLPAYVRANLALDRPGSALELWVVENGLCNRVRNGRSFDRSDGWDRPRYIRENIAAVVQTLDAGLPVTAYLHWSLVDNYEWGSYEPRFGIHGVDRERNLRVLDTDSMGRDAAGAYKRVIHGLKAGDRSVLAG